MSDKGNKAAEAATRILIVEDARFVAARLKRTLTRLGYDVLGIAASGEEALQMVSEQRPDLMLMDIYLAGELNGIETAAQIRAQFDIPVVYLTGHAEDTLLGQAKITEPYGYLVKPVQGKELHATIEMALHRHELEQALRASEKELWMHHENLEELVKERTAKLIKAVTQAERLNEQLQQEIAERVRTEDALRESEASYRELADSIADVFFAMDKDLKYTYWNRASKELTGISAEDAIGKSLFELFPDVRGTRVEDLYLEVLRTQQPQSFVNAYQLGDKNYFFEISAYPSGDGISVFTKDITERVQAQDALRESEEKYRALVENSPDGIFISDAERLIYTNKRLCEMTGFTQDEFLDMLDPVEMLFAPEERERVLAFAMGRLRGDPVPTSYKARGVRKGGEEILLRLTVSPIVLSGRPVLQGTVEDITERVRAAEEVRRRNRELALLNRVIATTTSTLDVEQVLQIACQELANTFDLPQAAATLLNAERSEAIVVAEYLAPGRPSALGKIISVVDNPATEYVLARKTSLAVTDAQTDERMAPVHDLMRERGTVSLLIVPVMERDEVVGTIGLDAIERRGFSDEEITLAQNVAAAAGQALETARLYQELQRHTAELARALEKQQELDRLRSEFVRNVSHEVRTPLALVRGHAELLEVGVLGELRPEQQESVVVIARRTRALTKIMDDFAAIVDVETKLQRRPVDMAELVHEMLTDSQVQAAVERASLTLAVEAVPDLSPMSGDPIQLRRVVDNLLDNALKFTPTGGHVVVRLWQEGENLVLKVSDTGIGIPRDQLERVFERFYQIDGSTTRRYGGTGLGLALVKEIVQAHRGQVTVQSTIGQGSTFTVTLPIDSVHPSHHT